MLPGRLIERNVDTNDDTLVVLNAVALVDRLAHKLPEAETKTVGRTLGDFE